MRSNRAAMRSLMPSMSRRSGERRNSPSTAWISRATCGLAALAGWAASASERAAASIGWARARLRRAPTSSSVLASQMVQVSTDANTRPIITALTMMSADMNMPHGVRSRGSRPGGDIHGRRRGRLPLRLGGVACGGRRSGGTGAAAPAVPRKPARGGRRGGALLRRLGVDDPAEQDTAHQPGAERTRQTIQAGQPEPTQRHHAALPSGPPEIGYISRSWPSALVFDAPEMKNLLLLPAPMGIERLRGGAARTTASRKLYSCCDKPT